MSRAKILVVDDDPFIRELIGSILQKREAGVVQVPDAASALEQIRSHTFDLILMDLQMPVLDGLEATSAIRHFETHHSRPAVPVVAYSSNCPGAGVLATRGLNGSLAKPCGDQELEDCLVRWCPTYRSAPAMRGVAQDNSCWQAASRNPDTSSASLRVTPRAHLRTPTSKKPTCSSQTSGAAFRTG
jgi:CheY-like chemotaxis protein